MPNKGRATDQPRRNQPAAHPRLRKPSGIANQPADEERATQERLPPREVSEEPSWTRGVGDTEEGELVAMTVADVMTLQPTALEATQAVSEAARAMRDTNIGDVLVTEGGRLVGILTDRDLVVRVLAEGLDPAGTSGPFAAASSRP
jgi:CBS domain-containing protein